MDKVTELLEEIQAICIGADSPDAIEHGERDPIEELQCCREDLSAISNIVEQIQEIKEQCYLDERYILMCNIIKEFFDWWDKAATPDNDIINAFVCDKSKEIDEILQEYNEYTKI